VSSSSFTARLIFASSSFISKSLMSYFLGLNKAILLELIVADKTLLLSLKLFSCLFGLSLEKGKGVLCLLTLILNLLPGLFVVVIESMRCGALELFRVLSDFLLHY